MADRGATPAERSGRRRSVLEGLFADRSSFAREFASTVVGRSVAMSVALLRTVLVPTLLGPASYGVWTLLTVIDSFSRFTHLGTVSALPREIPFYQGKGDESRAQRTRETALAMSILGGSITGAGILVAALTLEELALAAAFVLFAAYNFGNRLVLYYQTLFRAERLFGSEARIRIVSALVSTPLVLGAVALFGLNGLIGASVVVVAVVVALYRRRYGASIRPAFHRQEFSSSVRVGLPVLLSGVLALSVRNTDKIMIGAMLGAKEVGLFALGSTVAEKLGQLAWMIGTVLTPRLARRYGEEEDVASLRGLVVRTATLVGLIFPAIVLSVLALVDLLYAGIWQAYVSGEMALWLMLLSMMFAAIYMSYAGFFATIRKQVHVIVMQVAVLALNVVGNYVLIRAGLGITGAAISSSVCIVGFSVGQAVLALRQFGGWSSVLADLMRIYSGPVLATLLFAGGRVGTSLVPGVEESLLVRMAGTLLALLVYLFVALWAARRAGVDWSAFLARFRAWRSK